MTEATKTWEGRLYEQLDEYVAVVGKVGDALPSWWVSNRIKTAVHEAINKEYGTEARYRITVSVKVEKLEGEP